MPYTLEATPTYLASEPADVRTVLRKRHAHHLRGFKDHARRAWNADTPEERQRQEGMADLAYELLTELRVVAARAVGEDFADDLADDFHSALMGVRD